MRTAEELQGFAMSLCGLGDAEAGLRLSEAAEAERRRLDIVITMAFWTQSVRYRGPSIKPEAGRAESTTRTAGRH